MWGWGVMNSTAIKGAASVGYPMDHFIGVWWSGAEPDVVPAGDAAKGYKSGTFHGAGQNLRRDPGHPQIRLRQEGRARSARQGRRGALQPRRHQRDLRPRRDPHRPGQVRQEAAEGRAGAAGATSTSTSRRTASRHCMPTVCWCRCTCPAPTTRAPARSASSNGTASTGTSSPTGSSPIAPWCRQMYKESALKYAKEKGITPRDCSKAM